MSNSMYFDILMRNGHFVWIETTSPKKEPLELLKLIEKIVKENIPWENPPADIITRPQELIHLKKKAGIIKDNYLNSLRNNGFLFYLFSGEPTHKTEIEETYQRIKNLNLPLSIIPEELILAHLSASLSLRNLFNLAQINKRTYQLVQIAIKDRVKNQYGLKESDLTYERAIQYLASLHHGIKVLGGKTHSEIRIDPLIDIEKTYILFSPTIYFENSFNMLSSLLAVTPDDGTEEEKKALGNLKEAFIVAAKNGEIDVVRLLLSCGLPADTRNSTQETALLSSTPNIQVIQALLDKGANANQTNNGETSLWKFLEHAEITKLLCQRKAEVEHLKDGKTPLHETAEKCWISSAEILLKFGAEPNSNDSKFNKPLHVAKSDTDLIRVLLQGGANPNLPNSEGIYPLCQFIKYPPILTLLCQNGAKIKLGYALHFAVAEDLKESVLALLKNKTQDECRVEINRLDDNGLSPLFYAKSADMIKLLHLYNANINYQHKHTGRTALHRAVDDNHIEIVLTLLECYADLSLKDILKKCPVHYCKSNEIKEMLELYQISSDS